MELYNAACMAAGLLLNGLFIFGLMKITSHSFKSYRNYLIIYSIGISVYSVAIAVCDISMASSPQAFVMMSQGIIRGLLGVGIYLGIMSIVLIVLITLPVFRYTAIKRNWLYHHISSVHAIAPYCALTAMGGLLIYCMPAFFFKPDAITTEIAAPLLKSKFGLTKDHGYMAMIGYYRGSFEERWKAFTGLLIVYAFVIGYFFVAIVVTILIRREVVGRGRSKRRQFLEKRHLMCFWSQTILIMVLDHIPRYIWLTLPLLSIESDTPDEYAKYATPLLPVVSALSIVYTVPELYIHIAKARGKPVAPSMDQGTTNTVDN
ncbi:hypothetical protein PRIPAC_80788 [Pristionchus pacificus]|nr:hypothetical protein PRIPAC_80788 [Pristionchus pacificus]